MSLTDAEIDLVRDTFRQVARQSDVAAAMFYDRLFTIAPETRPMFPSDMDAQCVKLMSMLGVIVAQLHDHGTLHPLLADLARRHVGYGAVPAHYAGVGAALLWTLEHMLGERYTQAAHGAWVRAFEALSDVMLEATAGR